MDVEPTCLPEVLVITPRVFRDERGFVFESWHERHLEAIGIDARFVQDLHSHSIRHTLRGLHFQIQQPQGKLVRVARGEVFDVAIDLRKGSPRFGQWAGIHLDGSGHKMLWVPPGFAHGYLALSEEVDVLYKCSDFYAPQYERAIRWNDAHLNIQWPLPPGVLPKLSPKDAVAPSFDAVECFP